MYVFVHSSSFVGFWNLGTDGLNCCQGNTTLHCPNGTGKVKSCP